MKDVAHEAGVSTAVVSHVLRGIEPTRYRSETIARVQKAAMSLGYEPNGAARMLRQEKSNLIGLAINFRAAYQNPLVLHVYNHIALRGYQPIPIELREEVPGESQPSLGLLAAIIGVDYTLSHDFPKLYDRVKQRLPLVLLNPVRSREVAYIATDRRRVGYIALEHLAGLGHKRVLYAFPEGEGILNDMKLQGWLDAVKEFKLKPDEKYIHRTSLDDPPDVSGCKVADALLKLRPTPTGAVCLNSAIAMATMSELMRRGKRVPQDISVVASGYEAMELCCYPRLTSVVPPLEEVARLGVMRVIEEIEAGGSSKERKPPQQLIEPRLVVRESTTPPSG